VGQDDQIQRLATVFAVLLGTVTEMLRAKASRAIVLDAYDDASDQIIASLRGNGVPDERIQTLHKTLARLRLALEESK
jgi:hypothetical protein